MNFLLYGIYQTWRLHNLESFTYEKFLIQSSFEELESLQNIDDKFFDTVSVLSKKLWTVAGEDPHYTPPIERNKFR